MFVHVCLLLKPIYCTCMEHVRERTISTRFGSINTSSRVHAVHVCVRIAHAESITHTLKNKGASKGSSSDAIEKHFWFHKEPFSQRFSQTISCLPFYNLKNLLSPQRTFVKQKGSSDL